jgi:hypothetical protein
MRSQLVVGICSAMVAVVAVAGPVANAQAGNTIFVTPIPNAPFSGAVRVERTIIEPNGASQELWSVREIARDSAGRIHNEFRPFAPAASTAVPPVVVIHLYDPQSRMTEYLYPAQKTYRMMMLSRPPSTDTVDDFASPEAAAAPPSEFTRQQDLGYRTIAGLQAHGVRIVQTLSPEESGTGQEVTVTNEYWYCEALRLNLVTKHNDPRTGTVTTTVTQISRAEPSADLFGVPADYTMAGLTQPGAK